MTAKHYQAAAGEKRPTDRNRCIADLRNVNEANGA
jgi:hypothetical protein